MKKTDDQEVVMPLLQSMETAPRDGTKIIIFWYDNDMDLTKYNVREAWWFKPTELSQWKSGARPHWQYISDCDNCRAIRHPNGWMPKPKLIGG